MSIAKHTWESILMAFPKDPVVPETRKMLAREENEARESGANASLPLPPAPAHSLVPIIEQPWAPPDTDSAEYEVAPDVNCRADEILDAALHRLKSELADFEKFTATEHIEHQEVDRHGRPGPVQSRDFSYVVLVFPHGDTSVYLEESRNGGYNLASFPTYLATTGLNSLGVAVLQPISRKHFNFSCEGLADLRGHGAWQLRFEEKRGIPGGGVREWQRDGINYPIPIKGRIWIASASFAILRVETDLREPVKKLELTRDHLLVDYGPVNFSAGKVQLWLPWRGAPTCTWSSTASATTTGISSATICSSAWMPHRRSANRRSYRRPPPSLLPSQRRAWFEKQERAAAFLRPQPSFAMQFCAAASYGLVAGAGFGVLAAGLVAGVVPAAFNGYA